VIYKTDGCVDGKLVRCSAVGLFGIGSSGTGFLRNRNMILGTGT